eukprot:6267408-Alexandrium_andersonii.AAC.1
MELAGSARRALDATPCSRHPPSTPGPETSWKAVEPTNKAMLPRSCYDAGSRGSPGWCYARASSAHDLGPRLRAGRPVRHSLHVAKDL